MRVLSRFALVAVVLSFVGLPLSADHLVGQCPLSLVDSTPPSTTFTGSPHGVFKYNNLVFVLRGNTLTTYTRNDAGDLQLVRSDLLGSLGAREVNGGVAFSNGFLFLSSEAGFEIFDLRNTNAGGTGPAFVSRTPNLHYRRLAVSGNLVAGLYPATDLPCAVNDTIGCTTNIDLIAVGNVLSPAKIATIPSLFTTVFAFNDITFARGFLIATGQGGTVAYNISNPFSVTLLSLLNTPGTFITTNGVDLIGVGLPGEINVLTFSNLGLLANFTRYTLPPYLTIDRANPIAFHPQAWFDDPNGRLVTMIDEVDPLTLESARTVAFDVFDFTVPQYEGAAPRDYEALSFIVPDEVKYNPVTVGPYVYTVGVISGLQTWGACDQITGHIDWNTLNAMLCGGAEVHGWVTGTQKISNVELFLDGTSLGFATVGGPLRTDVDTRTPAVPWRITVNLDQTVKGDHILRAVGTDSLGNRRQFFSQRIYFPGPGSNCVPRRGRAIRSH